MDDSNGGPRKVKVVDRRKFTADGEPREQPRVERAAAGTEVEAPRPPAEDAVAPEQVTATEAGGAGATAGTTAASFLTLVDMLHQNALLLLFGAEDLPARPQEARTMIDLLGVLQEKTGGNLSQEEQQALSSVLYQLRALYVQKKP